MCGTNPLNRAAIQPTEVAIADSALLLDAEFRSAKSWILTTVSNATISHQGFLEGGIYRFYILATNPSATLTLPSGAYYMPGATSSISVSWTGAQLRILTIQYLDGNYYYAWDIDPSAAPDLSAYLTKTVAIQEKDSTVVALTLASGDNGTVIRFSAATTITVTLPKTLPQGFNVGIIQGGAGQVQLSAESGGAIRNRSGHTKSAGQYAALSLIIDKNTGGNAAEYNLQGDTAA